MVERGRRRRGVAEFGRGVYIFEDGNRQSVRVRENIHHEDVYDDKHGRVEANRFRGQDLQGERFRRGDDYADVDCRKKCRHERRGESDVVQQSELHESNGVRGYFGKQNEQEVRGATREEKEKDE